MMQRQDIQKRKSRSDGSGKGVALFAEHLTEDVLQFGLFIGRKRSNLFLQPTLVYCPDLVGDNLTVSSIYMTGHSIGIAVDSRSDGDDDDRGKVFVQSSTLSSSKMSAATSWSLPCSCALRAAADHPLRTGVLVTGTSVNTILRISRKAVRAFCMATSLSKMGLSSRSSSARNCIAVIIVNIYRFRVQKYKNNFNLNLKQNNL